MEKQISRQAYQTPILWRQLKEKLAEDINNSQLMMCEVEVVIKELYEQVQIASEKEYRAALAQQEADNKAIEEKQEEQK